MQKNANCKIKQQNSRNGKQKRLKWTRGGTGGFEDIILKGKKQLKCEQNRLEKYSHNLGLPEPEKVGEWGDLQNRVTPAGCG